MICFANNRIITLKPKILTVRPLFKDPDHQKHFEENGFVKLKVLDPEDIQQLLEFYLTLKNDHQRADYGFHVSLDNTNREWVENVSSTIRKIIEPKAATYLDRCKVFTSSFVIKEPGPKAIVPPHQDWTFVDETQFNSCTFWVPLQDVNMDNGALGIIRGSHKFFDHPRPSPSPQAKSALSDHYFTIFPYMEIIEMKAGEALVFDNRLIHASPPNTTEHPRIAAGIGITQEEAELEHHYQLPGTQPPLLEKFRVDETFFMQSNNANLGELYDQGKKPEGWTSLGTTERKVREYTATEMQELIKSVPGNTINGPLIEKLAVLFNYNLDGTKKEESKSNAPETSANNGQKERVYTLPNIIAEIKHRVGKIFN